MYYFDKHIFVSKEWLSVDTWCGKVTLKDIPVSGNSMALSWVSATPFNYKQLGWLYT